jgi:hypothetical protein
MTAWAVADRLLPTLLVAVAYLVGWRMGRAWQRLEQFLADFDNDNGDLL